MKKNSKLNLYHTFYTSKSFEKQYKNYNEILKGTKTILKNCLSFKNYINNYKKNTEVFSFKNPKNTKYPILNKRSMSLIPISKSSIFKEEEEEVNINKKNKYKYNSLLICDDIKTKNKNIIDFHEKIKWNLKSLEIKYKKYINKKKEKENPIISEFFYKWIENDNYSSLCYNESNIFYTNYNDLLKEKIQYIKNNKITNLQENIESEFYDIKGRKIKLELISIKIIFREINENNLEETNNEQIINLPLSFVFLYYINGFDFFKKVLLASINFSNNYQVINFNDKNIYLLIKKYFKNEEDFNNTLFNEKKKKNIKSFLKKESCNYSSKIKIKIKRSMTISKKLKDTRKKTTKGIHILNKNNDNENKIKQIKIIHVNREIQRKEKEKEKLKEIRNNKKQLNIKKENLYDELEFIWETPLKTYKVIIQLPIIKLWCELLNKSVITFCDQNLFLYMFKNNFINWDFYSLHYFFSIKFFRKLILKKYSYKLKPLLRTLFNKNDNDNENNSRNIENNICNNINKTDNLTFFLEKILYTRNKKIKNLLNENNESFIFFYTDNSNNNSIINFYSYHISIDYNELNPYKKWQFHLNFKQMKYLIKINRYELLETFLPKIIKTNFEYGTLEIDFSIFDDFNSNILNYQKNNLFNDTFNERINDITKKNNINIEIKRPYITIETNNYSYFLEEIEISQIYLNKFIKEKNKIAWIKIILKIIKKKEEENSMNEDE